MPAPIVDARAVAYRRLAQAFAGGYAQLYSLAKQLGINWTAFSLDGVVTAGGGTVGDPSANSADLCPTCDQVLAVKALAAAVVADLEADGNTKLHQVAVLTSQTPIGG